VSRRTTLDVEIPMFLLPDVQAADPIMPARFETSGREAALFYLFYQVEIR
jgi:hypothetical protein